MKYIVTVEYDNTRDCEVSRSNFLNFVGALAHVENLIKYHSDIILRIEIIPIPV